MILGRAEADAIDARIAEVEARTGVQVVAAVVPRSDSYPEVVWKAFALGAALAALVVVVLDFMRPDWASVYAALWHVLSIIGAGALSAVAAATMRFYARLFVNPIRADVEVRQHARSLFLARQLFRTRERNGVLLLASLFEQKVELIADVGFDGRVFEPEWHGVIAAMTPLLATHRPAEAIGHGLDELERLLQSKGYGGRPRDGELSNRPIEDAGA